MTVNSFHFHFCAIDLYKLHINIFNNRENCCSFDRINPKEGYTKENTQIISYRANRIKNDASADELLKIGHYMKDLESLV